VAVTGGRVVSAYRCAVGTGTTPIAYRVCAVWPAWSGLVRYRPTARTPRGATTMSQPDDPNQPGQQPYGAYPSAPVYAQQVQTDPAGRVFDQASGLYLPPGTQLAGVGRRVGAYFLAFPLMIITLGIGYVIWGLVLWGKGTSPALSVLGMKVWKPATNSKATWGTMFLRDFLGRIVDGILSIITLLISFILFVTGKEHKSLHDIVGGTVVLHDPNKVLG